jgi:hypothetical protein
MPRSAKWGFIGGIGLICAGAAYLMALRGPALLLDLGNAMAWCF